LAAAVTTTDVRRWRLVCAGSGLSAAFVTALAVLVPWFERVRPSGRVVTYTPWTWDGPHTDALDYPSLTANLIALAVSREWGLSMVIAAAVGMVLGLIAAAKTPTEPRVRRATIVNAVAAGLSFVLVGLMWYGFAADGGAGSTTSIQLGLLLGIPAQAAWLVLALRSIRITSQARADAHTATS
jgi:hypothetical protein